VSETWFYHLERRTLEDVLPGLLERARERGWRATVRVGSAERMEALDTHLWTYAEHTFLAHGTAADGKPARQPIYLTTEDDNPGGAEVLFLVGGARPAWDAPALAGFTRIMLLFDGRDERALLEARGAWQEAKSAGHDLTYWKESPSGKFEKQG
jgi:DNA polymerase-3 subunit chi